MKVYNEKKNMIDYSINKEEKEILQCLGGFGEESVYLEKFELLINMIDGLSEEGYDLYSSGKQQEALELFSKEIKSFMNYSIAWTRRGISFYNEDNYKKALICYCEAIRINPTRNAIWRYKGDCLSAMGKHKDAVKCFDEALKMYNNDPLAWDGKGHALCNLGKFKEAIVCYDKSLNLWMAGDILAKKGFALLALKRYEEAIPCFEESLEYCQSDLSACIGLALSIKEIKGLKEAVIVIDKVLEFRREIGEKFRELEKQQEEIEQSINKLIPHSNDEANTEELIKLRIKYCKELETQTSNN